MVSWIARGLLIIAGIVTGWFIGVVQGMVAVLLLGLTVAVLAFWPARWTHLLSRPTKPR